MFTMFLVGLANVGVGNVLIGVACMLGAMVMVAVEMLDDDDDDDDLDD